MASHQEDDEPVDRFTCEETFRRLDDYVDRELAAEELALVELHLQQCAVCAREYGFETSVVREVRAKLRRIALPPDLEARISRLLRDPPENG